MELGSDHRIIALLRNATFIVALVFVSLFPLFFLTSTSEFNEYAKLQLTIFASGAALLIWAVRALLERKFMIAKTPFDVSFVLLSVSFILATLFSVNRTLSMYGSFNNWHFTVVEFLAFAGLLYAIVTNVQGWKRIQTLFFAFLGSAFLVSLITLATYFGVFNFTQDTSLQVLSIRGFSPAGNVFSLLSLLFIGVLVGTFKVKQLIKGNKVYLGAFLVMTLVMSSNLGIWLAPYIPGLGGDQALGVQLNFANSWQIATASIRENALFGSGPSTYSLAYLAYRPISLNLTDTWNVIFNQSGNEYMTWLTTKGILGFSSLVFFTIVVLLAARKALFSSNFFNTKEDTSVNAQSFMVSSRPALVLGLLLIILLYLFTSSTVMTTGVLFITLMFWLLIEKQMASDDGGSSMVEEVELSLAAMQTRITGDENKQIMHWIIALPLVAVVFVTGYYAMNDFRSNLAYASSIRALNENQPAREVYESQQDAIRLNPLRDTYHRAYANTNITLARVIAQEAGETITESQTQDVLSLIQQAIREVRIATELLSPASAVNWQVRGSVYQNLLGVAAGADQWALHAYQNAVARAPSDPRLRLNVGSLFFTLAINTPDAGTEGEQPGEDIPQVPETKQANLARAEAAFLEAIQLKGDYANAHYNLAAVYIEADRLDLAVNALQNTIDLVDPESQDYARATADLEAVRTQLEQRQAANNLNNQESSVEDGTDDETTQTVPTTNNTGNTNQNPAAGTQLEGTADDGTLDTDTINNGGLELNTQN